MFSLDGIFKGIRIPAHFGCDEYEDSSFTVDEFKEQFEERKDITIYNGVTKCVLVFDNDNKVIKIPFGGFFAAAENVDDENEFIWFTEADDINGGSYWNYCENELMKYENAVDAGFGEFFAETEYCTMIDGTPIYKQEKCVAISCGGTPKNELSDNSKTVYKSNEDYQNSYINSDWVRAAIDWYGASRVLDFIHYIEDNNIYDLHNGNIGFSTWDGRPVLIDWAGYRD